MDRATLTAAKGQWPAADAVATVTLDYEDRCRRRMRLIADDGFAFLLDLAEAGVLAEGDGLRLVDGRWIAVRAAPERLTRIDCTDPHHLAVVAWHLGNRHLPAEIDAEAIYIRHDHVIEAMVVGLGAAVAPVDRPFTPESGAYAGHRHAGHGHAHGHGSGHGHDHGHDHGSEPANGTAAEATGGAPVTPAALYRLMTWFSPSYPVGAFSYSHGLETAVADGAVSDRETLTAWIATALRHGAGMTDAVLFRAAWLAAAEVDDGAMEDAVRLGRALTPTAEVRLQTLAQGTAFLDATRDAWPCKELKALDRDGIPLPVAAGAACAGHDVPVEEGLAAFLTEYAANLVSAGVRLIPLGQRDGQRAIAALEPVIAEVVAGSAERTLDDAGSATPMIDLAGMRHETLYTRLFRS